MSYYEHLIFDPVLTGSQCSAINFPNPTLDCGALFEGVAFSDLLGPSIHAKSLSLCLERSLPLVNFM